MRKSERIRTLEFQVLALEYEFQILRAAMNAMLESSNAKYPDIDAGKWYKSRNEGM